MKDVERPHFQERQGESGVKVLRPIFPPHLPGHAGDAGTEVWRPLLPQLLAQPWARIVLWVFSPRADHLVALAKPATTLSVYDCMDDLTSFRDGTEEMRMLEIQLMKEVDLVFTGGKSLYEARKSRHPRVHCFPSGIDLNHYEKVFAPQTRIPARLSSIPSPRLGYFGVLDERIDWPLIAQVAARRPEWQWILIGPTAKVSPTELPQAANIHYFGQQRYEDLPAFLKGFDVATMPFALNKATRYISPTKTLEYLAGGKDVVSTSVPDVVAAYRRVVIIADGAEAWVDAIERLLRADSVQQQARREDVRPLLENSTWDGIVDRMWSLIQDAMASR
ncbi:MAG: glycosyltransferase [Bryobacteraceae bacterium]|nr:glycosyltransferase [Bryobacteraceae bacterium]